MTPDKIAFAPPSQTGIFVVRVAAMFLGIRNGRLRFVETRADAIAWETRDAADAVSRQCGLLARVEVLAFADLVLRRGVA